MSKKTTANLLGRLVAGGGDCGHKAGKDVVQERAQLLRLRLAHVAAQQLVACRLVLACVETHSAGLQAEKLLKSTCFITAASVWKLLQAALLWEGGNATACGQSSSCTGMEQDTLFCQVNAPMRTSSGSTPTLSSTPRRKVPAVCQKGTEIMDICCKQCGRHEHTRQVEAPRCQNCAAAPATLKPLSVKPAVGATYSSLQAEAR